MASLSPSTSVLGIRKAKHLLRRACFHYSKSTLNYFATLTPAQAVSELSINTTTPWQDPYDTTTNNQNGSIDGFWIHNGNPPSSYPYGQNKKRAIVTGWWWYNMLKQNCLKHKLVYFLHTCFTVSKNDGAGKSSYFYDYLKLLDFYALGSIKTLAKKISFDNAMLYYLDNTTNNKNNPNENYAREFLELFTILKGPQIAEGNYTNYTENDIQQAARVFSGIKVKPLRDTVDPDTGIPFGYVNISQHDTGQKEFSSAFSNQTIDGGTDQEGVIDEVDDFVEMIFSNLETAKSYCRKAYRFFVRREWSSDVENNIIYPLSVQLMNSNYNLLNVVQTLLQSQHFYDEDNSDSTNEIVGGMIKPPVQFISELISLIDMPIPNPEASSSNAPTTWSIDQLDFYHFYWNFCHNTFFPGSGMNIFSPDTVAGYPGDYQGPNFDRSWFSSNTIVARYKTIESLIAGKNKILGIQTNSNGFNYYQNIKVQFNCIDFISNSNNISDPYNSITLVTELSELFFCESLDSDRLDYFIEILNDSNSGYWAAAWSDYITNGDDVQVKNRLDSLFTKLINAPEFQLM
ncbi:MAG: hypothetical protein CMC86_04150 [Flavobacteriaceae bacterium]|nr:hypothetical protein [Flavobacteriaceae bacterium]|tara:strand:- start:27074 stop:28789 length:1716 start_codon:yes stop_codon:yes gene_type:complete